jgi:hypothetical protein
MVGHAQAALEFRFDAHLGQHGADLRPAAMDDDRVDAGLFQKRDIASEGAAEFDIAHGVAAIFHHDRLVLVALHIGQGGGQKAGLFRSGSELLGGHGHPRTILGRGLFSFIRLSGQTSSPSQRKCDQALQNETWPLV